MPSTAIAVLPIVLSSVPGAKLRRVVRGGPSHKAGEGQAIGALARGLSTMIHALVDALGNPLGFLVTGSKAHDLRGADHLLPTMAADVLITDKHSIPTHASSSRWRLSAKIAVIPPRTSRASPCDYD
jgi:hypothetical protein